MYYMLNSQTLPLISYMNKMYYTSPYKHAKRIPGEYILYYIHSGNLYIREDTQSFDLHKGDFIILDPEKTHEGIAPSCYEHYYIHLSPDTFTPLHLNTNEQLLDILKRNQQLDMSLSPFSHELYDKFKLILPKVMHIKDTSVQKRFEYLMEQAILTSDHRINHYKLSCSTYFLQIASELYAYFSEYELNFDNNAFSSSQQTTLRHIMDFLYDNYTDKLTSADFEKELDLNFDYMNRLFKKKNGTTIFAYLNSIRIDKAAQMLAAGNSNLYEIACATGFSDEYYFNKVFKKYMGISPGKYAKTLL